MSDNSPEILQVPIVSSTHATLKIGFRTAASELPGGFVRTSDSWAPHWAK